MAASYLPRPLWCTTSPDFPWSPGLGLLPYFPPLQRLIPARKSGTARDGGAGDVEVLEAHAIGKNERNGAGQMEDDEIGQLAERRQHGHGHRRGGECQPFEEAGHRAEGGGWLLDAVVGGWEPRGELDGVAKLSLDSQQCGLVATLPVHGGRRNRCLNMSQGTYKQR